MHTKAGWPAARSQDVPKHKYEISNKYVLRKLSSQGWIVFPSSFANFVSKTATDTADEVLSGIC